MLSHIYSRIPPTMTCSRFAMFFSTCLALVFSLTVCGQDVSPRQDDPATIKPKVVRQVIPAASLQAINDDYARQLLDLERQRLERLGQLAARQSPKEAVETYEELLRVALANNLFREAEPAAHDVLKSVSPMPPVVVFLARTIDIVASADRGAYDESLADLRAVIESGSKQRPTREAAATVIDTSSLLAICDAYYQRLLQGGQFEVAKKAFEMLRKDSEDPAVKVFAGERLRQLSVIGKPAPGIEGTDLDGKPVSLAGLKGNIVLVVFWASWCLPSSAEVDALDGVYQTYKDRGFRVVGINVDTLQGGRPKLETVLPNVRRFLVEHNVRWPNLINGMGANDYAKAYGIIEIPSNVLIGRDGTVIHLDLSPRKNLADVVAKAVAP